MEMKTKAGGGAGTGSGGNVRAGGKARIGNRASVAGVVSALALTLMIASAVFLSACANDENALEDGYYTAQVAEGEHGWWEFVTICVNNNRIVTVEYQARTASGFIKSWDMDYMRVMNAVDGTYPNEYVRIYTQEFLEAQSPDIDAVSGATSSYNSFRALAAAVIEKAKAGDHTVALVEVPVPEE